MGFDGGLGSVDVHAQLDWAPCKEKSHPCGWFLGQAGERLQALPA